MNPIRFIALVTIKFLLWGVTATAIAQSESRPQYSIPRVDQAPVIDASIGPGEWDSASRIDVNVETNPGYNLQADVDAYALFMEDGVNLYVAFVAEDPNPNRIQAFFQDRDEAWGDDWMGIILDTFNDERRAFEFFVNPLGVQMDAVYDDTIQNEDDSWNAIWDSAGEITDDGYIVEISIPFSQLRFSPSDVPQTWGIDVMRNYPRDFEFEIKSQQEDRDVSCYLCQISKLEGFENLERARNLQLIPTLTASRVESRNPSGNGDWIDQEVDPQAGLDVRWGITQDIYLNATLNPDFSQVEADSAQLNINQTFSLFFPERRTFFLDGADYFDTAQNLVHTRNIASPDYGAKITGKSGSHTFGFLAANDENTSFLMPGNLSSRVANLAGVDSDVAIARYRYDIFSNSTIGALVTDRSGDGYSNTVASVDAVLRPTNQDTITIQSMRSSSEYPLQIQNDFNQAPNLSDNYHFIEYRHNDANWDVWSAYTNAGTDFRADLGFINRVDYEFFVTRVGHTWRWDDSFFSRIRIALDYDRTEDQSGFKLEEETELFLNMNGPLQSSLFGLFGFSETYWNGQYFDEQFNQLSLNFQPNRNLFLGMVVRYEDVVDFANTRLGQSLRLGPEFSYRWGRHLELDVELTRQQFDVDGGRLFTADLVDAVVTYQFSNRSFLRLTAQYTDNKRNPDLYIRDVDRRSSDMTTQLLYSYRLNAATRFFIGYSDEAFRDDRFNSLERTDRAFFAKFAYAWQP